jgi:L-amino acid N-acyltransferase YncA
MSDGPLIRPARDDDAERLAEIFNQGIEDRAATFETARQDAAELVEVIASGRPLVVAELDGDVVAWAKAAPYAAEHHYYAGVGEATLYVARDVRRRGVGKVLLQALAEEAKRRGLHKLVGKIFTSNEPSIALVRECGWREVGVHLHHGQLDGEWKDVLVVERLLGDTAA